jgi:type I restriction enzyme, S subunit
VSLITAKLGDLCQFVSGGTPSKKVERYFQGDTPWITGADVSADTITTAREYITEEAIRSSATKIIPKGNILLVTRTGVGKVAIAGVDICISQDFTGLIPDNNQIDTQYLFHFLKSKKPYFQTHQRGATIQGITRRVVTDLEIPLPPLDEQRRIAALLDQADALRQKRRRSLARLDDLLQSVFLEMFGDPVANPMGWETGTIRDLAAHVNYGSSKKASSNGQYPYLRMGNITYEGRWNFSDLKYMDLDKKEAKKYLVHKGQVLFNRTNSKELVGKTAVYREDKPMAFAGYLIRVIPNELADAEYIAGFLNSAYAKIFLREKCKSIVGMANINAQELQNIKLTIPPVELQKQYAAFVHSVLAMREKHLNNLEKLDTLFNSLQQRAFRGEL